MPRLFIGIPVPESYQRKLKSITDGFAARLKSRVKWTEPENAHVTLKFLGEVESGRLDGIRAALRSISQPAFQIRAGGCGCFPNEHRPNVIWAGVMKGAQDCSTLARTVDDVMGKLGFERALQPFKCHLTLGRVKRLELDDWTGCLREANTPWPGFLVDHFVLWESTLTPAGALYAAIEEFPLQQG